MSRPGVTEALTLTESLSEPDDLQTRRDDFHLDLTAEDSRKLPEDGARAELLHIGHPGVGLSINDTRRLVDSHWRP